MNNKCLYMGASIRQSHTMMCMAIALHVVDVVGVKDAMMRSSEGSSLAVETSNVAEA